ncbi:MAG: hypothetical protein ACI4TX_00600 [Christensenellales bacterium]
MFLWLMAILETEMVDFSLSKIANNVKVNFGLLLVSLYIITRVILIKKFYILLNSYCI